MIEDLYLNLNFIIGYHLVYLVFGVKVSDPKACCLESRSSFLSWPADCLNSVKFYLGFQTKSELYLVSAT